MIADDPKLVAFKQQILNDSGFCCRHVFGWNYDEDENTGERFNIGTGGVRADGPHKDMTGFLDKPAPKFKILLAPRGSYKSTILQGFCGRHILRNPNVRILYGMHDEKLVVKKSEALRNALAGDRVTALFGKQMDEISDVRGWTVLTRTQTNQQEPTFSTFTTSTPPVGGHYDIIVCDDLINDKWCSPEMMENAKQTMRSTFPLLKQGGLLIVVGTRWADDDIYAEIIANKRYDKLVMNSGDDIEVVQHGDGSFGIQGQPRFAHQSLTYLNDALSLLKPRLFMSQYMNVIANDLRDRFTREMFQPINWGDDMERLSGYLLTDTAGSMEKGSDYSVLAYAAIDAAHAVYLMDLQVGKWHLDEFIQKFFAMRERWAQKLNHVGETIEINQAGYYSINNLMREASVRQIRLNLIRLTRNQGSKKKQRIDALEPTMKQRRFFVVNTVPKTFIDNDGEKVLWDPQGFYDEKTKTHLPDGELVAQFIRHPLYPKDDIADAIADIEATDRTRGYVRFCTWKVPKQRLNQNWSLAGDRNAATVESMANFPNGGSEDFWSQIARKNGIHL